MAMSITPAWDKWDSELENTHNGSFGAGLMALRFEKFFEERLPASKRHLACLNFYYFVHLSRREHTLCVRDQARESDIDYNEFIALERDTQFKLKAESVL